MWVPGIRRGLGAGGGTPLALHGPSLVHTARTLSPTHRPHPPLAASRRRRPRADGGRPGGPVWPPVRPRPAHATACPTPRTTSPPAAAARVAAPHATTRWCATRAPRDDAPRGRTPSPPPPEPPHTPACPPPPTNPTLCLSHPGGRPACLRDRGLYSRPPGLPFPPPPPLWPRPLPPPCPGPPLLPPHALARSPSRPPAFAPVRFCGPVLLRSGAAPRPRTSCGGRRPWRRAPPAAAIAVATATPPSHLNHHRYRHGLHRP